MKKLMGLTLAGLLLAPLVFSATTRADYLGGQIPSCVRINDVPEL